MNIQNQITIADVLNESYTVGALSVASGNLGEAPTSAGGTSPAYNFTNGTSSAGTVAGVVDLHWESGPVVLAAAGSQTYTLSALTDTLGRTVAFARIRKVYLIVTAKTLTSNDFLTVGNATTHPWTAYLQGTTPTHTVRDTWLIVDNSPAALVVTAATNDQLKILNGGANSMTFQLILAGNST